MSDAAANDRQLTAEHIGQLENAQQVIAFFTHLGYDADRAIPLDHTSLGLDSADLRQQIRRIQRVAEGPAEGRIVVYLLEARSVTVSTEEDADYQWGKLRSAFTLAEWSEQYFNNRALLSDYYLLERLADPQLTPAWAEDVRPIGREVLRHLSRARAATAASPSPWP